MALYKNHASDERKTLHSATKTLGFQARFFFTRWMSGVRVPHRPPFKILEIPTIQTLLTCLAPSRAHILPTKLPSLLVALTCWPMLRRLSCVWSRVAGRCAVGLAVSGFASPAAPGLVLADRVGHLRPFRLRWRQVRQSTVLPYLGCFLTQSVRTGSRLWSPPDTIAESRNGPALRRSEALSRLVFLHLHLADCDSLRLCCFVAVRPALLSSLCYDSCIKGRIDSILQIIATAASIRLGLREGGKPPRHRK